MKRSVMHHMIRTLTALTALSSALIAAPDEQGQEAHTQTKRFLSTHRPTGLYILCAGTLAAGAYAAWKYWPWQQDHSVLDGAPLFEEEVQAIATVRSLLENDLRFRDPMHYPQYLAGLYNIMIDCLGTQAENRVELAREVSLLFDALYQNYVQYLDRNPGAALQDTMQAISTPVSINARGFRNVPLDEVGLLRCTFTEQPEHTTITVGQDRDAIAQVLANVLTTLAGEYL